MRLPASPRSAHATGGRRADRTVYVDDAGIPTTVGPHTSCWSHFMADSEAELHAFAARLGLRRDWFQQHEPRGDGTPDRDWHSAVTSAKRMRAIQLGAEPVSWRDTPRIIAEREAPAAGEVTPDDCSTTTSSIPNSCGSSRR